MTPGTWVNIKTPPCRLYDRGEVEGPAFVTSDGEQVYWIKFYIAPGRTQVLMFGETEVEEIGMKEDGMRLAIIDSLPVQPGKEIGPIFVGNLTKPEVGEKVGLSFVDRSQGVGVVTTVSGVRFEDWSYKVRVEDVERDLAVA
ncbi:MAG: hypothetical protein KJ077_08610 [Anaerolineae bacterium]|nr:hypothetical protein [Anaerolineae bacterium]